MGCDIEPTSMAERSTDGDVPVASPGSRPARRRFLTHGVAGGSVALLVAGKPVKTLAKAYCKFSGWNSVKVSKKNGNGMTLSNAPKQCSATVKPPSYYYTKTTSAKGKITYAAANWANSFYNSGTISSSTTTFNDLFGPNNESTMTGRTLLTILTSHGTTVEAYMIATAFASAQPGFPLSQQYVYDLWMSYGSSANSASLLTFLQQLV
jgi:hypothetical protein